VFFGFSVAGVPTASQYLRCPRIYLSLIMLQPLLMIMRRQTVPAIVARSHSLPSQRCSRKDGGFLEAAVTPEQATRSDGRVRNALRTTNKRLAPKDVEVSNFFIQVAERAHRLYFFRSYHISKYKGVEGVARAPPPLFTGEIRRDVAAAQRGQGTLQLESTIVGL
jgi:hypothetical protein